MESLIRKAKKGDKDAFCQLMDQQMQSMYKIAWAYLKNNEDVADVIQDTICTCYEKITSLQKNGYFKTWLTRILINHCKDLLANRRKLVNLESVPEPTFREMNYGMVEWEQVLCTLNEKYRTILLLYYMEGFQVKEIAQILDMKENTVKSRLMRGRQEIAAALERKETKAYAE